MRVAAHHRYGPPEVLEIRDLETPSPADDELLVRVRATTVTAADYRLRAMDVPAGFALLARLGMGITGPRNPVLGQTLSGVVEAVGKSVTSFRPGDDVFALTGTGGGYAEYATIAASGAVARKPAELSHGEAAALPFGGHTALHFLRKGGIAAGQHVMVYGASGDVGTAAVQLGKHFGATVTGVCSRSNLDLVRSLGADAVLDYATDDIPPPGARYDIVMDAVGKAFYPRWKGALVPGGRFLMIAGGVPEYLRSIPVNLFGPHTIIGGVAQGTPEVMAFLRDRAEAGELRPVIDRTYPLEEIVDAHRYADGGHKVGSVVIEIGGG